MLPEADLPLRVIGESAYFDFLGPQDEPWVQALLAEMHRFEGLRRRALAERLAEPLPVPAPYFKRRAASRVLLRMWKPLRLVGPHPRALREALFIAAAASGAARDSVLREVAQRFSTTDAALESNLFSDLPGERRVRAPQPIPTAHEVVLHTNLAIAQSALMRAASVDVQIEGATRSIIRLAKLRGLLCVVKQQQEPHAAPLLEISGPFSLFRHTLLYGRALAELVPHLAWCARFALRAQAALWGRLLEVTLDNAAPIFPALPPSPFDSKVEARFAADLARLALDWDVLREPEPLQADGTLIFPDFLLRHRIFQEKRVLIEIVGFWTADYLAKKFARLTASGIRHLILCIDEDKLCSEGDIPSHLPVVRYRRRVDAAKVLQVAARMLGGGGAP